MKNEIGKNLKKYRMACGYTPRRVAEFAEIEVDFYRAIERGEIVPSPDLVEELASIVRVSVARIYGFSLPQSGAPTARIERDGNKAVIRIEWGENWEWTKGDIYPYDGGIEITLMEVGEE